MTARIVRQLAAILGVQYRRHEVARDQEKGFDGVRAGKHEERSLEPARVKCDDARREQQAKPSHADVCGTLRGGGLFSIAQVWLRGWLPNFRQPPITESTMVCASLRMARKLSPPRKLSA